MFTQKVKLNVYIDGSAAGAGDWYTVQPRLSKPLFIQTLRQAKSAGQITNIGYDINMCMRSRVQCSHCLLHVRRTVRSAKIVFTNVGLSKHLDCGASQRGFDNRGWTVVFFFLAS